MFCLKSVFFPPGSANLSEIELNIVLELLNISITSATLTNVLTILRHYLALPIFPIYITDSINVTDVDLTTGKKSLMPL